MKIVVDGVIFQIQASGGISQIWRYLIPALAQAAPQDEFIILERTDGGVSLGPRPRDVIPDLPNITFKTVPGYQRRTLDDLAADDAMLKESCRAERADIFISSYYTRAPETDNAFMAYDMIPEVLGWPMDSPVWAAKQRAIADASRFFSISEATKADLVSIYQAPPEKVFVTYPACAPDYAAGGTVDSESFKKAHDLKGDYYLMVGNRGDYKNGPSAFRAFKKVEKLVSAGLVCIGGNQKVTGEEAAIVGTSSVTFIGRVDYDRLRSAYAGARALIYPSTHEGFGIPLLEAMACGCPVITGDHPALLEVADDACLSVDPTSVDELAGAMIDMTSEELRHKLITQGRERAKLFSWDRMAADMLSGMRA